MITTATATATKEKTTPARHGGNSGSGVGQLRLQSSTSLIDHHSSHPQAQPSSWTPPPPALGVPGGSTHANWTNPEWWPTQRGTPPHRPLDYNQEYTRRPWANGIPEQIFTRSMIGVGVQTIGLANTIWRSTIGAIVPDRVMRYQAPHEL